MTGRGYRMTGLEALKYIKDWFEITENMEECITIEKELKALEGIINYLDLRIKNEPIYEVKKAFEEIRNHIDILRSI